MKKQTLKTGEIMSVNESLRQMTPSILNPNLILICRYFI